MKLIIILSVVACSYAAKLDRTYLPPASAGTAGGSPGSLTAPTGPGLGQSAGTSNLNNQGSATFNQQGPSGFGQAAGVNGFKTAGSAGFGQVTGPSSFGSASNAGQPGSASGFNGQQTFGKGPAGFGQQPQDTQSFGQAPSAFGNQAQGPFAGQRSQQPERAQASADKNAEILRYDNQNDGETFAYSFETSNGISVEESGVATNGVQAQGGYSYTGDDGETYRVTYTADENGYLPQGDHLPTSPPIPDEILRSIQENARAAAAGTQEGAYNPDADEYVRGSPQQYNAGTSPSYQGQGSASFVQPQGPTSGQQDSQSGQQSGTSYNQQGQGSPQFGANAGLTPFGRPSGQGTSGSFAQQGSQGGNFGTSNQQGSSAFGHPQGQIARGSQNQGESGYQYDRPQTNSGNQGRPGQVARPQFNQAGQLGTQGAGTFQKPTGSVGQGSFGTSYGSNQGSFGPSSGPQQYNRPTQSQGGSGSSFSRPSGSPAGQGTFGPASGSQSAFGPSSRPQGSIRSSAPTKGSFGASGQASFGQSGQTSARAPMPQEAPYQYNRPGTQQGPQSNSMQPGSFGFTQGQTSPASGFPQGGPTGQSTGFPQGGKTPGFSQGPQGPSGQTFGAPRQPPSFSEQEGYKY